MRINPEAEASLATIRQRMGLPPDPTAAKRLERHSNGLVIDWRRMPDSKAKYKAYLASRDWALLKEQVRSRSGGICEHCCKAKADQVHHQTYERLYAELLTDLLDVCEPCHKYLSGRDGK